MNMVNHILNNKVQAVGQLWVLPLWSQTRTVDVTKYKLFVDPFIAMLTSATQAYHFVKTTIYECYRIFGSNSGWIKL